jgi:hypothetical protein
MAASWGLHRKTFYFKKWFPVVSLANSHCLYGWKSVVQPSIVSYPLAIQCLRPPQDITLDTLCVGYSVCEMSRIDLHKISFWHTTQLSWLQSCDGRPRIKNQEPPIGNRWLWIDYRHRREMDVMDLHQIWPHCITRFVMRSLATPRAS